MATHDEKIRYGCHVFSIMTYFFLLMFIGILLWGVYGVYDQLNEWSEDLGEWVFDVNFLLFIPIFALTSLLMNYTVLDQGRHRCFQLFNLLIFKISLFLFMLSWGRHLDTLLFLRILVSVSTMCFVMSFGFFTVENGGMANFVYMAIPMTISVIEDNFMIISSPFDNIDTFWGTAIMTAICGYYIWDFNILIMREDTDFNTSLAGVLHLSSDLPVRVLEALFGVLRICFCFRRQRGLFSRVSQYVEGRKRFNEFGGKMNRMMKTRVA